MVPQTTQGDPNSGRTSEVLSKTTQVGKYLKEAREKQRVSIKLISRYTKISVEMLEYLENDQLTKLPDKAYVVGYVKSYAKTLKIDAAQALEFLEEGYKIESNDTSSLPNATPSKKDTNQNDSSENTQISYKTIGTICVFILPLCYVVYLRNKNPSKGRQETEKNSDSIERTIESQTLSSKTPLIETKPSGTTLDIGKLIPENLPSLRGGGPLEIEEDVNKEIPLKAIRLPLYSIRDDNQEISEDIPKNHRNSIEKGKQSVFLLAEYGETWLTYQKNYGPVHQFFLKQGEYLFIKGDIILMFLGNVSAVKVFLNNKHLTLNALSRVKTLVFPQEKRNEYYYPLFIYKEDGSVVNSKDYMADLSLEN